MTVVIAMTCTDGVLVASDSMGSAGRYATRVRKLQSRTDAPVIWANSGTEYLGQALDIAVNSVAVDAGCTPMNIANEVDPALRRALDAPIPPSDDRDRHQLESLIVGWVDGAPSMVHIPSDLATIDCTNKNFVAIGSAHEYAHVVKATLDHHFDATLTTQRAALLAYRIVSVVCAASSWGVALPVQIAVVDAAGVHEFSEGDLEQLELGVERWVAVEADQLTGSEQTSSSDLPAMPLEDGRQVSPGA